MLDWLKTILGDAYTEDTDRQVAEEIGKRFVSKADFNSTKAELTAAKGQIADRDKQLEDLKKSSGDAEALKKRIEDLQAENAQKDKDHAAEIAAIKLESAVEAALTSAKAKNNVAVKALLTEFLKDAKVGEDGAVKGLDGELKKLAEAEDTAFLFEQTTDTKFKGAKPAEGGEKKPADQVDFSKMSYEDMVKYMEDHPDVKID